MSDQSANFWPSYRTGPSDCMHALGVIALNYNLLERTMYGVLAHHLQTAGMTFEECQFLNWNLNNSERTQTVKFMYSQREKDPTVVEHINFFVSYFNKCAENRNILLHSLLSSRLENHGIEGWKYPDLPASLEVQKASNDDWTKFNIYQLSLADLRKIADEMHIGQQYGADVLIYLMGRDQRVGALSGFFSRTLPEKPPSPSNLNLLLLPEAPASGQAPP